MKPPNNNFNILDKLESRGALTPSGKAWLVRALDPFHDFELQKVGYPDHVGTSSVVFEVQKSITISKPSVFLSGNWDCHIVQTPLACAVPDVRAGVYSAGTQNFNPAQTGIFDNISTLTQTFGGLVADCIPSGNPTFQANVAAGTRFTLDSADVLFSSTTSDASTVRCRLVATGFEVENTTAPLYRQGAVTIYNSPSHKNLRVVRPSDGVGTAIRGQVTLESFACPPKTEQKARAFIGSRTWHAEHGCYVPSRFSGLENAPAEFAGSVWMAMDQDASDGFVSLAPGALTIPLIPGTTLANACGNQYANIIMPIDNAGAYFTGLSDQTTLTIVLRQTWEIFPAADLSLMRLAQPSPVLDSAALEAYSHLVRDMPIGTIRGDNDAGKWFRDIMKVAGKVLPRALHYVPIVGDAIQVAEDLIDVGTAGANAMKSGKSTRNKQKAQVKTVPKGAARDPGFGRVKGKK